MDENETTPPSAVIINSETTPITNPEANENTEVKKEEEQAWTMTKQEYQNLHNLQTEIATNQKEILSRLNSLNNPPKEGEVDLEEALKTPAAELTPASTPKTRKRRESKKRRLFGKRGEK